MGVVVCCRCHPRGREWGRGCEASTLKTRHQELDQTTFWILGSSDLDIEAPNQHLSTTRCSNGMSTRQLVGVDLLLLLIFQE
jgi:hypothetical protein